MANVKISALTAIADGAISPTDVFPMTDADAGTPTTYKVQLQQLRSAILAASGAGWDTTDYFGIGAGVIPASGMLRSGQGAVVADAPLIHSTVTWNNAGVTFTHMFVNVTDTNSAAGSMFADFQVGGSSRWKVTKAGAVTQAAGLTVTTGGITVSAGTTAVQALTATTGVFSSTGQFGGTLTVTTGGIAVTGNSTITGTLGGITTLTATTLAGTLSTAAQPNVTSVGTLTSLSVGAITSTGLIQTTLTSQQLSLRYNTTNHLAVTVGSTGFVTYTSTGSDTGHQFANNVFVNPGSLVVNGGAGYGIALGGSGLAGLASTQLIFAAGTTGVSPMRIPHGSAPTTPVDGDIWTTTAGLFVRINGVTVGPLS